MGFRLYHRTPKQTVWPNTISFRLNPVMSWITSLAASNKQPWVFPKPGLIHITPTAEFSKFDGTNKVALNVIMPYSDSFQNLSKQMWWKVWGLNNLYHLYDNCGGNVSAETLEPSEAARTVNDTCNLGCASKTTFFDKTLKKTSPTDQRESTFHQGQNSSCTLYRLKHTRHRPSQAQSHMNHKPRTAQWP